MAADELFLKVDDGNRATFEAAGSEPFRPLADPNRPVSMSYFNVPLEVLEDPGELAEWARGAIRAATTRKRKPRLERAARLPKAKSPRQRTKN